MSTDHLKAGTAECEITGKIGLPLAGELEPRVAKGVRTPLFAKVLVLSNGNEELAIVTLDLLGLDGDYTQKITTLISQQCRMKPQAIMIMCSHTHAAPYTAPFIGEGKLATDYLEYITPRVARIVREARERLEHASFGTGYALIPRMSYNRRFITRNMKVITDWMGLPKNEVIAPEGPTDPELTVLVVRGERGDPLCFLWNFAAENWFSRDDHYSADLPYFVQQEVDKHSARHIPTLYLPGCGANIGFNFNLEETTDIIASALLAVQADVPCDPAVELGASKEEVILPIRDYSQLWSEAEINRKLPRALALFRKELELLKQEGAHAVPTCVQAFRVGDFALAGLPGAPFVELGIAIKKQSPFRRTCVAGYTNDYPGLVITRTAFEYGSYEAWPSRSAKIGPGGGEFLAEEAVDLLEGLFKS